MNAEAVEVLVEGLVRVGDALDADGIEDPRLVAALECPPAKNAARGIVVQEVDRLRGAVADLHERAKEHKAKAWDLAALRQYLAEVGGCVDVLFAEWFDMELTTSEMRGRLHSISSDIRAIDQWVDSTGFLLGEGTEVSDDTYIAEAVYFAEHRLEPAAAGSPLVQNALVLCSTMHDWRPSRQWMDRIVPEARCVLLTLGGGYHAAVFEAAEHVPLFLTRVAPGHPLARGPGGMPSVSASARVRRWWPVPPVTDLFVRAAVEGDRLTSYPVVHSDFSRTTSTPPPAAPAPEAAGSQRSDSTSASPEPELEEVVTFKAPVRYAAGASQTRFSPPPPQPSTTSLSTQSRTLPSSVRAATNKKHAVQWEKWGARSAEVAEEWEAEARQRKRRKLL